jgi:hypothetical protein
MREAHTNTIYPSIHPSNPFTIHHQSINLSIYQSINLSIYQSINPSPEYQSIPHFYPLAYTTPMSIFTRKKPCKDGTPKIIIASVVSLVLVFVIAGLLLALAGTRLPSKSKANPGLGEIGATCGGPSILPCLPGNACSVPPERWAVEEGVCIRDPKPAKMVKNAGESCGGENEECAWGLSCANGTCAAMLAPDKPFIGAVIPEGMELIAGSYRAPVGTKVTVRVKAVNVGGGAIYLKSMAASYTGVRPEDKAGDLTPVPGVPDEYESAFTVTKHLGADLIAVMDGADGQKVTLGVNVAAQEE